MKIYLYNHIVIWAVRCFTALVVSLSVAACAQAPASPVALVPTATRVLTVIVAATATRVPPTSTPTPLPTDTPVPTATATAELATTPAEVVEQREAWRVICFQENGKTYSEYYNPQSGEWVSVEAPEISGLTIKIQKFDGQQIATWVDTAGEFKNYRYPYRYDANDPSKTVYFEVGTVAWHQPKGVTERPVKSEDGKTEKQVTNGFVVMVPEYQATRQNAQTPEQRLAGEWRIGLAVGQKEIDQQTKGVTLLRPYEKAPYLAEVILPNTSSDADDSTFSIVNPISVTGVRAKHGGDSDSTGALIVDIPLTGLGYVPSDRNDLLTYYLGPTSNISDGLPSAGLGKYVEMGEILVDKINGEFSIPGSKNLSVVFFVAGAGNWESFGMRSLDEINGQTVVCAPMVAINGI